jgi:hypothetical protein
VAVAKKLRLNNDSRARILAHGKTIIDCVAEREAERDAFMLARSALRMAVEAACPAADMAVLRRYRSTVKSSAVSFFFGFHPGTTSRDDYEFCLCLRDARVLATPSYRRSGCHRVKAPAEDWMEIPEHWRNGEYFRLPGEYGGGDPPTASGSELLGYVGAYRAAATAHDQARRAIIQNLSSFLDSVSTFDAVLEHWPHASVLADELGAPKVFDASVLDALADVGVAPPAPPVSL